MLGDDFSDFPLPFSLRLCSSLVFMSAGFFPSIKTSLHVLHTFLRAALTSTNVIHSFQSLCYDQESGNKWGFFGSCWLQTAMMNNKKDQRITSPYL